MSKCDTPKFGKAFTDQLGLCKNFFYNLKKNNPECLAYIEAKAPGDIVKAYRLYIKEKVEVTERAGEIYHELEDKYLLFKFGKYLVHKKIYKSDKTYFYSHRTIFKGEPIKSFKAFLLIKKSNALYDDFMLLLSQQK